MTDTIEQQPTIQQMLDEPIDRDRVKGREGPSGRHCLPRERARSRAGEVFDRRAALEGERDDAGPDGQLEIRRLFDRHPGPDFS